MTDSRTPIWDYLYQYAQTDAARLHMPGHKGRAYLGPEPYDVTEIEGADSLYCPEGIIADSEDYAALLFGSESTLYSCGGNSQCIMATMWLLRWYAAAEGRAPLVVAARNAHQSFVSALAATGLDVSWVRPPEATPLACPVSPCALDAHLDALSTPPVAVYITSPDYLGNMQPVEALAEVAHRHGALLVVDNAHGAYLRFYGSRHPLDEDADIVCDSAHKTLGVLTGGAYLHLSSECPSFIRQRAREAMLTVGSTSPSYLILASLDIANATLNSAAYRGRLRAVAEAVRDARRLLSHGGWRTVGDEPLKLTIYAPHCGYTGTCLAEALLEKGVVAEYADRDHLVLMASADTPPAHLDLAVSAILALPILPPSPASAPLPAMPPQAMSVRDAYLSPRENLYVEECEGKVLAYLRVSCPPAVPVVVPGERLTADVLRYLAAQGYESLDVVME